MHTRKGRFVVDVDKVPFFNIPDLTGFNLKPYVSHATAKIDAESYEPRKIHLTPELLEQIEETIRNTPRAQVRLNDVDETEIDKWTRSGKN